MDRNLLFDYRAMLLQANLIQEELNFLHQNQWTNEQVEDARKSKLNTLHQLRLTVEETLAQIPLQSANILTMRYLLGYTWEEIANKLNYTYQWVHNLHKRALKEWDEIEVKNNG